MAVSAPIAPPTQNPQQTAADLDGARNRARMQQQMAQPPLQIPQMGAPAPGNQAGGQSGQAGDGGAGAPAATAGRPTPRGAAPKPGTYAARRQAARARKQAREPDTDPAYPNPIGLRTFIGFGVIAVSQDVIPLVLDLLGIGWFIGYCMLPITWAAYFHFIIKRAPKPLKKKFIQRTAMASIVALIPVVGEILPEWTVTAVLVYVYISRYERQRAYQRAAKASRSGQQSAKKTVAQPEPAAAAA